MTNAALVAMRPKSGEVLVMLGSVDFNNAAIAGQVNVALSRRQPGSAIKPVLYAAALEEDLISPATVLWDTPVTYTVSAGQIYAPRNYDDGFHGPVTARTALANSYNIPTVKLLDALSVEQMLTTARAMGVQSLNQASDWYGLSLTLGG
ncbi:MAG: penicillin-binding transpeptidase domain-containing protein [Caldilineaceae bacterium]